MLRKLKFHEKNMLLNRLLDYFSSIAISVKDLRCYCVSYGPARLRLLKSIGVLVSRNALSRADGFKLLRFVRSITVLSISDASLSKAGIESSINDFLKADLPGTYRFNLIVQMLQSRCGIYEDYPNVEPLSLVLNLFEIDAFAASCTHKLTGKVGPCDKCQVEFDNYLLTLDMIFI